MKRNILAVVIPALLVAGAANAAEMYNKDGNKVSLYGKVDARHVFSSDKSEDGDATYARFGFKGETQINSELTGYGQWEYNFQANNSESSNPLIGQEGNKTRLGFAGLKFAEFGSLDYGRNYGVVYDVEAWTDVLPVFGGDSYTYTDNFMNGRTNGVLTYRNNGFFGLVDGLNVALQYQGKNGNTDESNNGRDGLSKQNGDGFGMSASYDLGWGVSAAAAFSSSNRTLDQKKGVNVAGVKQDNIAGGDKAQAWTTGLKYDANNVYVAAMYAETLNMTPYGNGGIANKTQNFEAVAQYQFDFGLRPSIAYLQSKGKQLGTAANVDKDLVKYLDLGSYYYFNKNMSAYVDYKINLLDGNDEFYKKNGISTDNIVGVGMIYQF
ncbi:porin OmpC [Edwardsiella tarda]|nr:porin OmpC [Edwardsiella tarda]